MGSTLFVVQRMAALIARTQSTLATLFFRGGNRIGRKSSFRNTRSCLIWWLELKTCGCSGGTMVFGHYQIFVIETRRDGVSSTSPRLTQKLGLHITFVK